MYAQIKSGSLFGLASEKVLVETDLSPGLPAFNVVGLPDATVRESKERIRVFIFPIQILHHHMIFIGK